MTPVHFGVNDPLNAVVGEFVSQCIWGRAYGFSLFASMGVFDRGSLVAGTVYHNYQAEDGVIELSSASTDERWLTRPVIRAMFAFPFDALKARLVVLRVSERNDQMRGIARRFGFQETIIPRIRGDHEAECVYTLSASDWAGHRMNR